MNREEAIAIIRKEYLCVDRDCDIDRSCGKCDLMMPSKEPILEAYKMAIKALEQEPKTGHWMEIAQYSDGNHKIECSECESHIFDRGHANSFNVKNKYKYKYCPNCGCRMVEPQESEDKCKNCEYYHNPDYTRCHKCKAESEDKE